MVQIRVLRAELLEAMRGCLQDLEELKLLSPDDLDIIDERRILRRKIAELEAENWGNDWQNCLLSNAIKYGAHWHLLIAASNFSFFITTCAVAYNKHVRVELDWLRFVGAWCTTRHSDRDQTRAVNGDFPPRWRLSASFHFRAIYIPQKLHHAQHTLDPFAPRIVLRAVVRLFAIGGLTSLAIIAYCIVESELRRSSKLPPSIPRGIKQP